MRLSRSPEPFPHLWLLCWVQQSLHITATGIQKRGLTGPSQCYLDARKSLLTQIEDTTQANALRLDDSYNTGRPISVSFKLRSPGPFLCSRCLVLWLMQPTIWWSGEFLRWRTTPAITFLVGAVMFPVANSKRWSILTD